MAPFFEWRQKEVKNMAQNEVGRELCDSCNAPQHCNNRNQQDDCDTCRCVECKE